MRRDHSLIMKIEILAYSQLHMYIEIKGLIGYITLLLLEKYNPMINPIIIGV